MKDLLNLLTSGDYTTFMILSLIFIFIWLFKDIKTSLLETKKSDLNFIDQSIEAHAQTLKSIYFFFHNSISENDLLIIIYSSYKYFDKPVLDIIENLISSSYIITSEEKSVLLMNLSKKLKEKLNTLKDKQLHITINKDYKFTAFEFFNIANRTNLDIYFNAFLYSSIILFISLIALDVILEYFILNRPNLILLIIYVLSAIFWFFSISISVDLIFRKYSKKNLLLIIFFILPFVLICCIKICQYYMVKKILSIAFILCIFIGFYINIKYFKKFYKK